MPYYAAYRFGYPAGAIDDLAVHLGLDGTQKALDIGCGTGQLALFSASSHWTDRAVVTTELAL